MSLKETKEKIKQSEAGGGVGTRVRAEGVAAIGLNCEGRISERAKGKRERGRQVRQGARPSGAERGVARARACEKIPKVRATRAVHVLTLQYEHGIPRS